MQNRRSFFATLGKVVAGFSILPSALISNWKSGDKKIKTLRTKAATQMTHTEIITDTKIGLSFTITRHYPMTHGESIDMIEELN